MKLQTAVELYVDQAQARRLSPNTIRDYQNTFSKFIAYVGVDAKVSEITKAKIIAFFNSFDELSNKTLLNYHVGLSALWSWAVQNGFAEVNIPAQVPRPKPESKSIHPYTHAEIKAMLSAIGRSATYQRNGSRPTQHRTPYMSRNRAILLLLLDSGIRVSELVGAAVGDFYDREGQLTVKGKGNKTRVVQVSHTTIQAVKIYLDGRTEGPLFLSGDRSMTRDEVLKMVKRVGKRTGVKGANVHRFRHTFAIEYLRNGGRSWHLQQLLGHTTMEMVNTYLKLSQLDLAKDHRNASPVENLGL